MLFRSRVFAYGSCVSRDTLGPAARADGLVVAGYVARQSVISAFGGVAECGDSDLSSIKSKFQRSMVRGDLVGDLASKIAEASDVDLILWDLTDERFGVRIDHTGAYFTPSSESAGHLAKTNLYTGGSALRFGTDEHFGEFCGAARKFAEMLAERNLLDRTLLAAVPHSGTSVSAGTTRLDPSLEERAERANLEYGRYYSYLSRELGFPMEIGRAHV